MKTKEKSNDLRHVINTKDAEGNDLIIKIRLNDECKNGHQDFSITAEGWEKGKPHTDKYMIYGGCCHDEILKAQPILKMFVDLHLSDCEGVPMYAVENGFYHLHEGFNNTKPENPAFKSEFCDYYRITPAQFDVLNNCKNKLQYALALQNEGILAGWKRQAVAGIKMLENYTGKEFVNDSVKTQYHAPTPEEIKAEQDKEKAGYYTPEAEQQREQDKINAIVEKLKVARDKDINKANMEYLVKCEVLRTGGTKALDNCIFYNHTNQLAFNWMSYGHISTELIQTVKDNAKLPEGVTIK